MKNLLKILVLLLFPLSLIAQEENTLFAPDGAEWYHTTFGGHGPKGNYRHSKVMNDTIINGITARKIEIVEHYRDYLSYARDTTVLPTYYMYSTEDTVFVYNDWFEDFTPLYVYNVEEGDTLCLPMIPHPFINEENNYNLNDYFKYLYNPIAEKMRHFCITIDSIRLVEYDGEFLETYFTSPIFELAEYYYYTYPVYNFSTGFIPEDLENYASGYAKKIGSLSTTLLPIPMINYQLINGDLDTLSLDDFNRAPAFFCYNDGYININLTDEDCDYIDTLSPPVSIIENEIIALSILPNPMEDDLHIHITENFNQAHFRIYDYLGREVLSGELKNQESVLDVKALPKGLYLLRVMVDGGESVEKIMKK